MARQVLGASVGVGAHRQMASGGGGRQRRQWPHRLSPTNAACSFNLFLFIYLIHQKIKMKNGFCSHIYIYKVRTYISFVRH